MRLFKQFVYGALYLIVIGGVGAWTYERLTRTPPTCTDGIQNQHEEETDCGGECAECEAREREVRIVESPRVFALTDRHAAALVRVKNQSTQFWLPRIRYTFVLYDAFGVVASTSSGATTIGPGEEKNLAEGGISLDARDVGRVEVFFDNLFWERAVRYLPLALRAEVTSHAAARDAARVSGKLTNSSRVSAGPVRVGVLLIGRDGAAKTLVTTDIDRISPLSSAPFEVVVPLAAYAASDLGRTEVFFDRRR
ncbi:MAG: hypothetical protein HY536_01225 [Candidatus Colwellbacteria bacterium]|nr:hypothetical protein [Candidatus Colwellbacteria bacterium]